MKKRKIFIVIVIIIIIVLVMLLVTGIAASIGSNIFQEKKLKDEISRISELSEEEQSLKQPIKTKGDYAVVEKAVKDYHISFSEKYASMDTVLDEETLGQLTSSENLEKNAPDFIATKEELDQIRKNWTDLYSELTYLTSEEGIMSFLKPSLDASYAELYQELVMGEDGLNISDNIPVIEDMNGFVNNLLDVQSSIIDLLKNNAGKWIIENGTIYFDDTNIESEYSGLLEKMYSLGETESIEEETDNSI